MPATSVLQTSWTDSAGLLLSLRSEETSIRGSGRKNYPDTQLVRLGGRSIYVVHDIHELQIDPVSCGIDVVISGHSHRPRIETVSAVLYLNPGSAGPRRFNLPITLATLDLAASDPRPLIHYLAGTG
jgi:putative phosphoesterase